MTAYPESASEVPKGATGTLPETLVCGVNWLGDSVMAMPAVRELKRSDPSVRIVMLVKTPLLTLWRLVRDVDTVLELQMGLAGAVRTAVETRRHHCGRAFVLPHSFRSALVPFLAGVPERIGMHGRGRDGMLTRVVAPGAGPTPSHQSIEYFRLMGLPEPDAPVRPELAVPTDVACTCRERLGGGGQDVCLVGMLPGSARGPSKCWPPESFSEVGRRLVQDRHCKILLLGSARDRDTCADIALGIGSAAVNLAGATSLAELAGFLSLCRLVVANDSGGMHLATAVGTPVVAMFGLTDPAITGPLGPGNRVLTAEGAVVGRDIPRRSRAARKALASITSDAVYEAAGEMLETLE